VTAHALERLPIDQLRPWPRNGIFSAEQGIIFAEQGILTPE
jgi:hypothetical protein